MTLPLLRAALAMTLVVACTDAPVPSAPASREGKGLFARPDGSPESWLVNFDGPFDECGGDYISCAGGSIPEVNLWWSVDDAVVPVSFARSGCCALAGWGLNLDLDNRTGTSEVAVVISVWVGVLGGSDYVVHFYGSSDREDTVIHSPPPGWTNVEFELRAPPGVYVGAIIRYDQSFWRELYFDDLTVRRVITDEAPPVVRYDEALTELWPVNHKLVRAVTSVSATDEVDGGVPVTVGVEASGGSANYQIVQRGDGTQDVLLRAERLGNEGERVYRVFLSASDAAGNQAAETLRVVVPHDQRRR